MSEIKYTIRCCEKMKEEFTEDQNMIQILDNVPFSGDLAEKPQTWFCSDGGHGGMLEIDYCPFCGTEIKIIELGVVE